MNRYRPQFNYNIIDSLTEIDKEIDKSLKDESVDESRITNLEMEKLLRGMQMFNGFGRYNGIPY